MYSGIRRGSHNILVSRKITVNSSVFEGMGNSVFLENKASSRSNMATHPWAHGRHKLDSVVYFLNVNIEFHDV